MRIAVDAMGGDHAPQQIVEGAVLAAREVGTQIVLVGDQNLLRLELGKHKSVPPSITIHHAGSFARYIHS